MTSRSCTPVPAHGERHRPHRICASCRRSPRSARTRRRTSNGCQDREPSSITYTGMPACKRPPSLSRAPHARCGKSCASWATSWTPPSANESRWSRVSHWRRCRWISKMPPQSPSIPTASASTWWKCSTSSMPGLPSSSARRLMRISMPKLLWRRWCTSCANRGCQPCSPLTMIPAGSAVGADATFPRPCAAFCCAWASYPISSPRVDPI
jgi:hypothetical protein